MHRKCLSIILFFTALSTIASSHADENLLKRQDLQFLTEQSTGINADNALKTNDENPDTSAKISLKQDTETEWVYSFSDATVTPTSLSVMVAGLDKDQASIEILVSEDGPDIGYLSLRTERLAAHGRLQRFTFEPAAAKWLMVKIAPYGQAVEFELKEIEIAGYEGPPVSLYAFNEAPSKAIDVINSLEQIDLTFDIHSDEIALIEDAQDGQLDNWSFAEASLISSGVYDTDQRALLLQQLDKLTDEARILTANTTSAFDKGRLLLEWLHEDSMSKGYVEAQTDMSEILTNNVYNCVSSATLYNIVGKRLGLDARGIEVPDHAFSILYDGTDHVDVETTTPRGFDPARDRAAMNEFSETTGYTYINDKHRAKRREIDDAGMVALTYYNHGVRATEKDDFSSALLFYFRALSLDPQNKSAIKNTLAVLGRWSKQEIDEENFVQAVAILDAALSFAPADRTSRHNMRYALSRAMQTASSAEAMVQHVAFAQDLYTRTDDNTFLRLQSRALQGKAYDFFQQGKFEEAIALTETVDSNFDDRTVRELERLKMSLFLNWSSDVLDTGDHAQAMDILGRAYKEKPTNFKVQNNIVFIAQKWAALVSSEQGPERSQTLLQELTARFPEIRNLPRMTAGNFDVDARAAADAGDYEAAIEIYQSALKLGTSKSTLENNEKIVWNKWGLSLLEQQDYAGALTIFENALVAHPGYAKFSHNVVYSVQEWSKSLYEQGKVLEAETIIAAQRERFPDNHKVAKLQGYYISSEVNASRTTKEFEALEPMLKSITGYIEQKNTSDKLVGVFYQNWAKTIDPEFSEEAVLAVLQSGVSNYPENRHVQKLFVYTIDKLAEDAIKNADWERVISIYESASKSLPAERSFERKLRKARKQQ